MIKNLIFGVYLLISDFLVERLKAKANKTGQKGNSFYNTASLKNPHAFYKQQLTQHYRKYPPKTQPKTWFWVVSEKTFGLHHF